MIQYKNFTLLLVPRDTDCKVIVSSQDGDADLEFTWKDLDSKVPTSNQVLSNGGTVRGGARHKKDEVILFSEEMGKRLFQLLFSKDVLIKFDDNLESIADVLGIRVRLKFDLDDPKFQSKIDQLYGLPWELLKDARYENENKGFLSLRNSPIIRDLAVGAKKRSLETFVEPQKPLKVLLVAANPPSTGQLDLKKEIKAILGTLQQQQFIDYVTKENISKVDFLRELKKDEYDILHYMGHGEFQGNKGVLVLEKDGKKDLVDAQDVLMATQHGKRLKLAFLNACDTATRGKVKTHEDIDSLEEESSRATSDASKHFDPFSGMATKLVEGGIPAVIAMQKPIYDDDAVLFSQIFYKKLFDKEPLESCITSARIEVSKPYMPNDGSTPSRDSQRALEWATPVLFMRSSNGRLFPSEPDQRVEKASPTSNAPAAKSVYLYYDESDRKKTNKLSFHLKGQGVNIVRSKHHKAYKEDQDNIKGCDAYILVKGALNQESEQAFLAALQPIITNEGSRMKFGFTFLVGTESEDKKALVNQPAVINGLNEQAEPDFGGLMRFLTKLNES